MITHNITVYGPGCIRCTTLAENAQVAVQGMQGDYRITKISDPLQMADAGVFNTPALSLDGELLVSGKVLSPAQIRELLQTKKHAGCLCSCSADTVQPDIEPSSSIPCHCDSNRKHSGWKTALLIGGVGLLALAGIKQWQAPSQQHQETVFVPAEGSQEELVYFTFGKRCPTCLRMEAWTRTVAEQRRIPFRVQEADAKTVEQYGLTTKSLIFRKMKDGEESSWKKLDRIWELSRDEAALKNYVSEQIDSLIEP